MALDFPASPAVNDLYPVPVVPGVAQYKYDGEKWVAQDSGIVYVMKAGDTMTGNLALAGPSPTITLNKSTAVQWNQILGNTNGTQRWLVALGTAEAEAGGNAGSNFSINSYDDAGAFIGTPLSINRATSVVTVGNTLSAGLSVNTGTVNTTHVIATGNAAVTGTVSAATMTASGQVTGNVVQGTNFVQSLGKSYANATGFECQGYQDGGGYYAVFAMKADAASGPMYMNFIHVPGSFYGWRFDLAGTTFDFRNGGQAVNAAGGPWQAYSDARIKTVLGDYVSGLDQVAALRPVRYVFKGNDTDIAADQPLGTGEDGKPLPRSKNSGTAPYKTSSHYSVAYEQKEFIGLVAQEIEAYMPETVTKSKAFIDGAEVTDLRTLDTGPILFALINAVKELKARVEALEAAP